MSQTEIAKEIKALNESIVLIYAFNSTGKTQLSVAYKNATKSDDGSHAGVYYNAYSEDLFTWENDEENDGADIRLKALWSPLSKLHASLNEINIDEKLGPYKPKYKFRFKLHDDTEKGIDSIAFYIPDEDSDEEEPPIKISRGEERIFVWCFFLALSEVDGWADEQNAHFFIDDPVSSLDDHNIFVTASSILSLIESNHKDRKIILTTHHIGLFSILWDWLTKSENKQKYAKQTKAYILSNKSGECSLESCSNDVLLYHLKVLQVLNEAIKSDDIRTFHFALLRQVLENIASFLGEGRFGYVLNQIGIDDENEVAKIINALSHKKVYYYESDLLVPDNREMFIDIVTRLQDKYNFKLQAG